MDCSELSSDDEVALTGDLTAALGGSAVAFVKGRKIVFDDLSSAPLDGDRVEKAVRQFVSKRKDAAHYSVDRDGDTIVVHSPDPIAASHGQRRLGLPPNLFQCPFCPFVTPYRELYVVHYRSHGFI